MQNCPVSAKGYDKIDGFRVSAYIYDIISNTERTSGERKGTRTPHLRTNGDIWSILVEHSDTRISLFNVPIPDEHVRYHSEKDETATPKKRFDCLDNRLRSEFVHNQNGLRIRLHCH